MEAIGSTFFMFPSDPAGALQLPWIGQHLERRLAAFDGDRIVGTYRTFPTRLTLPGGASVAVSAVAAVSTLPTHRRRGILRQLLERDVADTVGRGEVASVLHAAEWPIYGRFGYGPATAEGKWTLRARATHVKPPAWGSIEIVTPAQARPILPEIFARHVARQAAAIERPEHFWDADLGLVERPTRERFKGQVAIHRDATGTPDGYVRFTGEEHWDEGIPDNIATVADLIGQTPEVELELWRFMAALDLVATVKADRRRVNEPLMWALADARAAQLTRAVDGIWVRPYDVAGLLGSRAYEREAVLVLEIADQLGGHDGPAAGRYRLRASPDGADCRRTSDPPDLTISASALGAAILGGTRLVDTTRAGGADEHRPGALLEADRLFRTAEAPWCSTFF